MKPLGIYNCQHISKWLPQLFNPTNTEMAVSPFYRHGAKLCSDRPRRTLSRSRETTLKVKRFFMPLLIKTRSCLRTLSAAGEAVHVPVTNGK